MRHAVEAAGARLPVSSRPYSPDFNPIENAFSKLKALLRKAARAAPSTSSGTPSPQPSTPLTPGDCVGYFTAAGYEPD